jgi:hypothetical protein
MTNLSKRVEKAKELKYSHSPYRPHNWGTWGSGDGEKYYRITLSHQRETITTPDGKKTISVFEPGLSDWLASSGLTRVQIRCPLAGR